MALFPIYGVFQGDFVPHLVAIDTENTMSQVAEAVAVHSVGRRVAVNPSGLYEAIVAGEVRHHDALRAAESGVTVICALHSHSERIALPPLATRVRATLPGLAITLSAVDRDPFAIS